MITEALVAFTLLLKFPLPAVKRNVEQLTRQLFVLLKDYSKAGAARGENYLLVQNCFKVFAPKCRQLLWTRSIFTLECQIFFEKILNFEPRFQKDVTVIEKI